MADARSLLADRQGDDCPAGGHLFETRGDRRACIACGYSLTADDIARLLDAAQLVSDEEE